MLNNSSFQPFALRIGSQLRHFEKPVVMGIFNLTPDSFFAGSRKTEKEILQAAEIMLSDGAEIIDIGGQSTRPGAARIAMEEEWQRVEEALRSISKTFPQCIISIDTFYSEIAKRAVENGAHMVNDVSAGKIDEKMYATVGALKVPYVLMHMQGEPQNMQDSPHYENIINELVYFFSSEIKKLSEFGVYDVLIDPGFGFGKLQEHNLEILRSLREFSILGMPLLAGMSRKKMIQRITETNVDHALNGTIAANTIALLNGASILRVHDVKAACDAVAVVKAYSVTSTLS